MVQKMKYLRLDRIKIGGHDALVLRDRAGKIRKVAKGATEEAKLTAWFNKYGYAKRQLQFEASIRLKEHIRNVKAYVRKKGFIKQISMYGIFKDPETKKRIYCRYEVFKRTPWQAPEVKAVHTFLRGHKPKSASGVFIYNDNKLYCVASDKVTRFGTGIVGYVDETKQMDTF
jgi:hypothetical protein